MIRELAEKKRSIDVKKCIKIILIILLVLSLIYILFLAGNIFLILLKLQNFSFVYSDIDINKFSNSKNYYYDILLKGNIEALQAFASIFTPVLALITLWQGYNKFLKDKKQEEIFRKDKQFVDIMNNLSSENMSVKISAITSLPLFSNIKEVIYDKFTSKKQYHAWLRFNYPYLFETIETLINTLILTSDIKKHSDREIISRSCTRALSLISKNTSCFSIVRLIWPMQNVNLEYYNAIDLTNRNLRSINISNLNLDGADCIKSDFGFSYMESCYFKNCNFVDTKYINTQIRDIHFQSCNLHSANFDNAHFFNVDIYNVEYENKKSDLYNLSFRKTELSNLTLGNISFHNCVFENINFNECIFSNIEFVDCKIETVGFEGVKLDKKTFERHKDNIFEEFDYIEKTDVYPSLIKYGILNYKTQ